MGTMKEKQTIHAVQKSIVAFFRENRRMPSFAEMVGFLGVRSKSVVNFWIDKLIEAEILEKALLQKSLLKRLQYFIESTDWEERYLCSHWIDKMCPHAVFLPVDYEAYSFVSVKFKEVLRTFSPVMEDVGIDEEYLDVTDIPDTNEEITRRIKAGIKEKTGLTCSIGIASNKLLAKIASDKLLIDNAQGFGL
jgi:hypothetical protein